MIRSSICLCTHCLLYCFLLETNKRHADGKSWEDHPNLHSNPFSIRLFNFGAGGTLPTHERILFPATLTVHLPHSPFLQSVGTFIPSLVQAYSKNTQQRQRTKRNGVLQTAIRKDKYIWTVNSYREEIWTRFELHTLAIRNQRSLIEQCGVNTKQSPLLL